jgi:hypothetical protein
VFIRVHSWINRISLIRNSPIASNPIHRVECGVGDRGDCRFYGLIPLPRLLLAFKTTLILLLIGWIVAGCASIRVTDPDHTADELYLENVASKLAVDQVSATVLRDRRVYVDMTYITASTQPTDQQQYLVGELRAKLLLSGVRLMANRKDAEIIIELRSQGTSVNHIDFLLGLPQSSIGGYFTGGFAGETPELAIVKRTQQHGFSSVAFIAYWADTGEVVAASGPFVGRTYRDDYWFCGLGPRTLGNVPPAEPSPEDASDSEAEKNQGPPSKPPAAPSPPPAKPKPSPYQKP